MKPLDESPYSYHFLALRNLGSWLYDARSKRELNYYIAYRLLVSIMLVVGLTGLFLNLYLVLGDMKKLTWNLCVTSLLILFKFKDEEMIRCRKKINTLRIMLHRDAEYRQQTPEDILINNHALKELKIYRISFYGGAMLFIPTWVFARYSGSFYGMKELPIPFYLPPIVDLEDNFQYNFAYFFLAFWSIIGIMITIELELAMYTLLIQISREYRRLLKDIPLINRIYVDEDEDGNEKEKENESLDLNDEKLYFSKKEVNPWLKKLKTKMLVKRFSARHKTLIEYTEAFESSFNKCFLHQFCTMSVLMVALALQCFWESFDFSGNLVYQMGYLAINVMDLFLTCLLSTRLRSQCLAVGETIYSCLWYRMSAELQRDLALMILRSQRPPKLTTWKFKEVNLRLFMKIMFHLYSWLTLIRQLDKSAGN